MVVLKSDSGVEGHRSRMKKKFMTIGIESMRSFEDYEFLEVILYYSISRRDTKAIAKKLLAKFGNLRAVLCADRNELIKIEGLGKKTVEYIHILGRLYLRVLLPINHNNINIISDWSSVLRYCQTAIGNKKKEAFLILFLNKKNVLVGEIFLDTGTIDRIAVYPREISRYALINDASAVLIVHNHPSGYVAPSENDVLMTQRIIDSLNSIEVVLHDHIIVARCNEYFSLRAAGMVCDSRTDLSIIAQNNLSSHNLSSH